MKERRFINNEEKLFDLIRRASSTIEEYKMVIESIENINYTDGNDSSFLHQAVIYKKSDIVHDLLYRGIDVDLQDVNGFTAAMFMVESEQWDLLTELFKFHPNVNLKEWRYGNSLLWYVVFYKSEIRNEIAKKMIKMGANPYSLNSDGKSPLDSVVSDNNEELIKLFSGIERPIQEEPQKFRIPHKRSGIFPLKMKDYMKVLCVENATMEYLKYKIEDYATIAGGEKTNYKFKLVPIEGSQWILIYCPPKMDFYNYHNLLSWIYGLKEDETWPSKTICVAINDKDERLSYYGTMDKAKYGDQIVGRFQNGESFSVYLPEANKKEGNAKSYSDVLPIKIIDQYLETCGLDEMCIRQAANVPGVEIEAEMSI